MIRGNVFFEVEKIEQLALINRLTTHHDLRPSLKGSDDGIMIRQYPRGLFQQHRSNSVIRAMSANVRITPESGRRADIGGRLKCASSRHQPAARANFPKGRRCASEQIPLVSVS